jgi:flagella basal body P-ring formation protein FlgA
LSDGAVGQRIRVRNLKSKKVVEGVVDPAGFVRTE